MKPISHSKGREKLEDITFIVFDFETTGLYPLQGDKICEIGAVKTVGMKTVDQFSQLINPLRPIPLEASRFNGITDATVRKAPVLEDVLPKFLQFIDPDAILVAHNVPVDLSFFTAALQELELKPLKNLVIDTLYLSRKLYPHYRHHNLDELRYRFRLGYSGVHRGLGDALATRDLLWILFDDVMEMGDDTFQAILKFHGLPYRFPKIREMVTQLYTSELAEKLETAMSSHKALLIEYISPNYTTSRLIDPYFLLQLGKQCYLRAYCHLRGKMSTFRLDRILRMELTDVIFTKDLSLY
jgi:DNA polymerase III epsilon subunit family exonuclease